MANLPRQGGFGLKDQLRNLSDEELDALEQEISKSQTAQNVSGSLLRGAEGVLAVSQGRPFHDITKEEKPDTTEKDLDIFKQKERIKREIKSEFETEKEPSAKEKIETKLLEAVASQLGITSEDVEVTEKGEVAVKSDISLPPGTTVNIGGVTLPVIPKKSAVELQEEKEASRTEKSLPGVRRFFRSFQESIEELEEAGFGSIQDATIEGSLQRVGATIQEKTGTLPKTEAFQSGLQVAANAQARLVEGGRVTDADRAIYAKALVSAIGRSSEANIRLAVEKLLSMKDKGGNIEPLLEEYRNSGIDLFEQIASEAERVQGTLGESQGIEEEDKEFERFLKETGRK